MENYLIWWLAQCDYERIPLGIEQQLPEYISKEHRSRVGRCGRGRLWIPEGIPIEEIPWDETKPLAAAAGNSGGIVLKKEDVK